jgi:hypothetical protein
MRRILHPQGRIADCRCCLGQAGIDPGGLFNVLLQGF